MLLGNAAVPSTHFTQVNVPQGHIFQGWRFESPLIHLAKPKMTMASLTQKRLANSWDKINNRKPLGFGFGLVLACLLYAFPTVHLSAQNWAGNINSYINPTFGQIYLGESMSMQGHFDCQYPYYVQDFHFESPLGTRDPNSYVVNSYVPPYIYNAEIATTFTPSAAGSYTYYACAAPYYASQTYPYYIFTYGSNMSFSQINISVSVGSAPYFTTQPAPQTIPQGESGSFRVAATMTPAIFGDPWNNVTYQWQASTDGGATWNNVSDGGNFSGSATATLNLINVTAGMNHEEFLCVANNHFGSTNSSTVTLVVANGVPASIQSSPASQTIRMGPILTFSVVAGGSAPFTYQWESSTDGGATWNILSDGGAYSGSATSTLTVNTTSSMVGYEFAAIVSNPYGSPATSAAAVILPASVPALPLWALVSFIALVFWGAKATLLNKHRTI